MKFSKYYSLNLRKRPFQVFAISSVALFILSFFVVDKSTSLNLQDMNVVISVSVVYWWLAGFLLLIWLLYIFIKKRLLSRKLIWIHAVITIFPIVMAIIAFNTATPFNGATVDELQGAKTDYWVYSVLLFIAVSAQFVLILNIAGGIVKRLTKKRGRVFMHDTN